jgi:ankyrin repeat domain-containing protein 50
MQVPAKTLYARSFSGLLADMTLFSGIKSLQCLNTGDLITDLLTPEKIATSGKEQMGALLLGLNKVLYLIDRCRIYEILYIHRPQAKDHMEALALKNLTSALVELYAVILQFVAKANRVFEKNTALRVLSAFLNPEDIIDLERKCDSGEKRVEIEVGNCERYCRHLAQSEEVKKLRNLLQGLEVQNKVLVSVKSTVDALWNQTTKDERTKILAWTSDIQFQKMHALAREGRTPDTGEWLLEHKEFKKWSSSDESTILWLHGIRKSSPINLSYRRYLMAWL